MASNASVLHTRVASGLIAVLGAWLVVSPWFYGFASEQEGGAPLTIATGCAIGILGMLRCLWPREGVALSWSTLFLGCWIILAPWAGGYETEPERLWNSTAVGTAVLVFSVWIICSTAIFNRDNPWRSRQMR
jgi:hypothetical protein